MVSDLEAARALVTVADDDMVPLPGLFWHDSRIHGQAHVARVLVHALRLAAATGAFDEAARLWAAVYLHDIARRHDGRCRTHGADAWERLGGLPDVRALFTRGGVRAVDGDAIAYAVRTHCAGEPDRGRADFRLAALLKDADGLDRVRLGDLRPGWLRHDEARAMVGFAQRLHDETNWDLEPGPGYFTRLWPHALRLHLAARA
jgi:hypothetical protein